MDNIIRLQNRINFENQNSFDKSLSNFTCMIEDIMSPFFKTMPYVNNKPYKPDNYFDKPWFNTRCKELYRCYIDYLHVFNRSKSIVNHTNLTCAKREYKVMERRLKREYQRIEGNAMDFLKYSNPKLFYSKFRKRTEKKKNVPLQSFYEHFKKLSSVNIDNTCDEDLFNNTDGDCVYPELDEVITEEEILKAIRNLKRNKSHGVDGILNEYFIEYKDVFMPTLVKVFNGILQSGIFPTSWAIAILVPIFKKGNEDDPNNFIAPRGKKRQGASTDKKFLGKVLVSTLDHEEIVTITCDNSDRDLISEKAYHKDTGQGQRKNEEESLLEDIKKHKDV
ncbi:unnamed protein product [Mytilus edulis]|uniref:Reverse transcriptase domain-containing protein n=1 Tax=Mytilus edulis TaxID=6550 RepID=A0A8S3VDM3_MYTED|nr:unnamed protein product [Mytilus edulis]